MKIIHDMVSFTLNTFVKISIYFAALAVTVVLVFSFVIFTGNQLKVTNDFEHLAAILRDSTANSNIQISSPKVPLELQPKEPDASHDNDDEMLSLRMRCLEKLSAMHKQAIVSDDAMLDLRIIYLDRLSTMHRQATANDLLVFLYTILSSVLIVGGTLLLKKTERQAKELQVKSDELNKEYSRLQTLSEDYYEELKKNTDELNEEYSKLKKMSEDYYKELKEINRLLLINNNSLNLHNISQGLSEAMTVISNYTHALDIDYLVLFKVYIKQVALSCEKMDFSNVDNKLIDKIKQRLGHVIQLYEKAANKRGTAIDNFHKDVDYSFGNVMRHVLGIGDD